MLVEREHNTPSLMAAAAAASAPCPCPAAKPCDGSDESPHARIGHARRHRPPRAWPARPGRAAGPGSATQTFLLRPLVVRNFCTTFLRPCPPYPSASQKMWKMGIGTGMRGARHGRALRGTTPTYLTGSRAWPSDACGGASGRDDSRSKRLINVKSCIGRRK